MNNWPAPKRKLQNYASIPPEIERVGSMVLDSAFRVHTDLGPGLLESANEAYHAFEIRENDLGVMTQVILPVTYRAVKVDAGFQIDILVENCVIVEIKAVEKMNPIYEAQLLTYLKLSDIRLGFLININVAHLKEGIKRMAV
jgi:GxxExxY protein